LNFESLQLHPKVAAGVKAQGFTSPTPIQEQAIPHLIEGRDLLGLAQTGTGKTAAFALPILQRLMKGQRGVVRALIVAPTRELAEQICDSFYALGRKTGLKTITVYGGVGITPQIQKLRQGCDIVVACPGRLLDHLQRGTISLKKVEALVLDEADRMFDMGFMPEVRKIVKRLPKKRQSMLFSATMPDDVRHLVDEVLTNPETVQIDRVSPAETVAHALYPVTDRKKTDLLLKLLKHTDTESVLVFTRTKHRAERIAKKLKNADYAAASLQGNLSQARRNAALNGFRDGTYQVLVATDIAARGIDVSTISHVINYDMPDTVDAYIHRIGRTGRAAKTGDAFTLVTNMDAALVRGIEKALGASVERRILDDFDYGPKELNRSQNRARKFHQKRMADKAKSEGRKAPGRQGDKRGEGGNAGAKASPAGGKPKKQGGGKPGNAPKQTKKPGSAPNQSGPGKRKPRFAKAAND
jgi:ATP-dependent RNA helicase RhlE